MKGNGRIKKRFYGYVIENGELMIEQCEVDEDNESSENKVWLIKREKNREKSDKGKMWYQRYIHCFQGLWNTHHVTNIET